MANTGDGYRDFFSQDPSTQDDSPSHPISEDMSIFSQSSYVGRSSAAGNTLENLDLNSHANNFPFLVAYTGYLQPDFSTAEQEVPPMPQPAKHVNPVSTLLILVKEATELAMVVHA